MYSLCILVSAIGVLKVEGDEQQAVKQLMWVPRFIQPKGQPLGKVFRL